MSNTSVAYPMHEVNAARFIALVESNVKEKFPGIGLRYAFDDTIGQLEDIHDTHRLAVRNLRLPESPHFSVRDRVENVSSIRARIVEIIEDSKKRTVVIVGFSYHKGNLYEEEVLAEAKEYILEEAKKLQGVLEYEGEFYPLVTLDEYHVLYFHIRFTDNQVCN